MLKQVYLQKVELKKPDILLTYVLDPQVLTGMPSPLHSTSLPLLTRQEFVAC